MKKPSPEPTSPEEAERVLRLVRLVSSEPTGSWYYSSYPRTSAGILATLAAMGAASYSLESYDGVPIRLAHVVAYWRWAYHAENRETRAGPYIVLIDDQGQAGAVRAEPVAGPLTLLWQAVVDGLLPCPCPLAIRQREGPGKCRWYSVEATP